MRSMDDATKEMGEEAAMLLSAMNGVEDEAAKLQVADLGRKPE